MRKASSRQTKDALKTCCEPFSAPQLLRGRQRAAFFYFPTRFFNFASNYSTLQNRQILHLGKCRAYLLLLLRIMSFTKQTDENADPKRLNLDYYENGFAKITALKLGEPK